MSAPDPVGLWLDKVDSDLLTIANNMASDRVPWDSVCFHAQQAAEKALKAYLVSRGITPDRTHDCLVLLQACAEYDADLAQYESACLELAPFAVAPRYPIIGAGPTEAESRQLVAQAREIVRAVVARLQRPFSDPLATVP